VTRAEPPNYATGDKTADNDRRSAWSRSSYAFGDSDRAANRLEFLSRVFEEPSRSFLTKAVHDSSPEMSGLAIDLGCGPGYSSRILAEHAQPSILCGMDFSEAFVDKARGQDIPNATWCRHDVTVAPFPTRAADLVYARLVLAHLPDPARVVDLWVRQVRPGGRLLIEDTEWIEAGHSTLLDYEEMAGALVANHGGDLYVGGLLRQLEPGPVARREVNRLYCHGVSVPVAAGLFAMNFATWRTDRYVTDTYSKSELDAMADELGRLSVSRTQDEVIFGIRQVSYRRSEELPARFAV